MRCQSPLVINAIVLSQVCRLTEKLSLLLKGHINSKALSRISDKLSVTLQVVLSLIYLLYSPFIYLLSRHKVVLNHLDSYSWSVLLSFQLWCNFTDFQHFLFHVSGFRDILNWESQQQFGYANKTFYIFSDSDIQHSNIWHISHELLRI